MSAKFLELDSEVSDIGILKLAQFVSADPVALDKWDVIMHHFVKSPASLHDLRHCKTEERILKTIQLWKSENGPAATFERFCALLRDAFNLVNLTNEMCKYLALSSTPAEEDSTSSPTVTLSLVEENQAADVPKRPARNSHANANAVWRYLKLTAPLTLPRISFVYGLALIVSSSLIVHDWWHVLGQCNHKYDWVHDFAAAECNLPYNFFLGGVFGILGGIFQTLNVINVRQRQGDRFWAILQCFVLIFVVTAFVAPVWEGAFSVRNSYDGFKVRKSWMVGFFTWTIIDTFFVLISSVAVWIRTPVLCSHADMDELEKEMNNMDGGV